ncbi:uncharacterized protein LOC143516343 [Brachyhypopomus gauderio]|uniref:uncharacterized protein LOC143516343 n=1 Tax=Brachyhypopomus gauderio TaxID=698409 RepID=UPI0040419474
MPGYKSKPKKGKKPSKRHHRSSPSPSRERSPLRVGVLELEEDTPGQEEGSSPRQEAVPTQEQLEQDPVCAFQLAAARGTQYPELAKELREGAVRIWRERQRRLSPARALSPLRVDSCVYGAVESTPESEFGEEDSEEEQEGEDYPPSICDASTVDYGGEEEEEEYPPSEDSASTVDYGGGDGEEYPPSEDSASTVDYGREEAESEEESEDEDYLPPPVCPSRTAEKGEEEEGSYTTEEEESPPPSERSAETVRGKRTPSSARSRDSDMDCSRGGSPEQPMEWSQGEEEEMETEGDHSHGPFGQSVRRAAPGTSARRAAPGTSARRAAPGTSARRAAPGTVIYHRFPPQDRNI